MSLDNKQEDFYKQGDDTFWNKKEDTFWDSDERYIRKEEYRQDMKQDMSQNMNQNRNQNPYGNTYQNPGQNQNRPQNQNINWNHNYNQNPNYNQNFNQNPLDNTDEYKKNSRMFGWVVVICVVVVIVAVIFSILYMAAAQIVVEKKVKELDYTTQTHMSNESLDINHCEITVSDAYILCDSTEVWMPSDKMLIAVYVEAVASEEYVSDAGIKEPYLKYGDGYYVYPVTDSNLQNLLVKMGFKEDDFLSTYGIGDYKTDAGYYFFLVNEDADDLQFIIDERVEDKGRIEFLKARHFIELELDGYF